MITTDSSVRHRSEAASEALAWSLLDQIAAPVIVCDARGFICHVSPPARSLCSEDPLGRTFGEMFPLNRSGAERAFCAADDSSGVEVSMVSREAGMRHFLASSGPLRDGQGKLVGRVVTLNEITEHKRLEAESRAARAAAEQANGAKSHFLAAASHDLRQPLSAIALYIDVLTRQQGANADAVLTNMKHCIASLGDVLSNLLDLSALEAGAIQPHVCDFTVEDLLAGVVSHHARDAQLKGLRLRRASTRLGARTDPALLRRVVGNLVTNALRYTQRGGVLLGCRRHQGRIWIEVWDTGRGIPEEGMAAIHRELRPQGGEERMPGKGSGLGLTVAARTAALLGLRVRARSRPGKGSVFAIELPSAEPIRGANPPPHTALDAGAAGQDADPRQR